MATCYITMICDEVWVDRGESAINESCYRPILVESSPAQWCIASQPTLRQKLEHNQHSSYSWTLSPWLTMNNKVCLECWFVFSYFRREWHARDVWHCLVLTYRDINQDIVIMSVLTCPDVFIMICHRLIILVCFHPGLSVCWSQFDKVDHFSSAAAAQCSRK